MKFLLCATTAMVLISHNVYAGRKVTIPVDTTLKLSNTSNATVTYNVSCKDKDGTVISSLASTGATLNAGKTITVGSSSASVCASGWTENTITGASDAMKRCYMSGGTAFSNIASACSASAAPCTLDKVIALKGTASGYTPGGAFVATGTWSYYNGSAWTDYNGNTTNYGNTKFDSGSSTKYATGSNGTGTVFNDGGWVSAVGDLVYDVACCALYSGIAQCEVEITSSTGHLSSPQFLGGKPF